MTRKELLERSLEWLERFTEEIQADFFNEEAPPEMSREDKVEAYFFFRSAKAAISATTDVPTSRGKSRVSSTKKT